MIFLELEKRGLIRPPSWMGSNIHMLTMMGSVAYGVSTDMSDVDVYGWAIPPKEQVFPHLAGAVFGFDSPESYGQFVQHHIPYNDREYDVTVYNIVKYFRLAMENNPNMVDSLFVPEFCVLHSTGVGNMVREKRKLFLHKGCFHNFKNYAISQLHKMTSKEPKGKRIVLREKYGFDVKFAYNVVRLLDECEQILMYGDLDLQRNNEHLKAIRRGDVSEQEIRIWATDKQRQLEELFVKSTIPTVPDVQKIKALLLSCLEHHYGSLERCVTNPDAALSALQEIQELCGRALRQSV